jgi:hypothetical protein
VSDHYCCKKCGQRYDVCECGKEGPYTPLGWPDDLNLTALLQGIDSSWTFEYITRYPPRQIREMFGDWRARLREAGPLAQPMRTIPQKAIDTVTPKVMDQLIPDREWFCTLRVYVVGLEDIRRVAIYTTKYVTDNCIFKATFKIEDAEKSQEETRNGLRQALVQFNNAIGAGP